VPDIHGCPLLLPTPVAVQLPVAPQYWLSVFGLTQLPPQSTSPFKHVVEHAPPLQAVPDAHFVPVPLPAPVAVQLPLAPQYALSVLGLMQLLPQSTSPLRHVVEHAPLRQTCPGPHAVPPAQLAAAPQ
jgi:hypothetical protein